MKYSRTAIGLLTAQYRSVLKKCLLINLGLYALGAVAATPANAINVSDATALASALQSGDDITVTGDIADVSGKTNITDKNNTLNLGGYTISGATTGASGFDFSGGSLTLSGNGSFNGLNNIIEKGILTFTSTNVTANGALTFEDNKSNKHGAAFYYKDQTSGTSLAATFNGDVTFNNNESTSNNSAGGAILNTGGKMSFLGNTNNYSNNKTLGTIQSGKEYKRGGGAIANQSYENESTHATIDSTMVIGTANSTNTFSSNSSSSNGGAIMNRAVDEDGNAYLTLNGNSIFTGNSASELGGAIYNHQWDGHTAKVTINGSALFSGNTANGEANDIYNTGILNLNATAITDAIIFNGGITGDANSKGTTNISGEGFTKVANTLQNQTVSVASGATLQLDGTDLTGTTIGGEGTVKFIGDASMEGDNVINSNVEVDSGEELEITNATITTTASGKLTNNAGGTLKINNSVIGVAVDNFGTLISDPTTYSGVVTNATNAYASFDNDTFDGTAQLANSGTVDLKNGVTFDSGATITGAGITNLVSGTTHFNNTSNTNTIYLTKGAHFDGTINGGTLDTRNGYIDSSLGSYTGSNLFIDADLTAGTMDAVSGTIKKVTLVNASYDAANTSLTTTGSFDDNVSVEGLNYYTKKELSGDKKTLTFSDKLVNESGVYNQIGAWAGGTYIGANADLTNAATGTTYQTAGQALAHLDSQIGTWTGGNYIKANADLTHAADGTTYMTVGQALGKLDTGLKTALLAPDGTTVAAAVKDAAYDGTYTIAGKIDTKQATITGAATTITDADLTANKVLVSDASGKVAASGVSTTTLGYLDATSSIQTQLNNKINTSAIQNNLDSAAAGEVADALAVKNALSNKQGTITGAASTITTADLTADKVLISSSAGKVVASTITTDELARLSGVTSNVQTQLDAKAAKNGSASENFAVNALTATSATVGGNAVLTAADKFSGTITDGTSATTLASAAQVANYVSGKVVNADSTDTDKAYSAAKTNTLLSAKAAKNGSASEDFAAKDLTVTSLKFAGAQTATAIDNGTYADTSATTLATNATIGSAFTAKSTSTVTNSGADAAKLVTSGAVYSAVDEKLNKTLATKNAVLITNASTGNIEASTTVDATELGYLDGVTSGIQSQLNNKLGTTISDDTTISVASGKQLTFGNAGKVKFLNNVVLSDASELKGIGAAKVTADDANLAVSNTALRATLTDYSTTADLKNGSKALGIATDNIDFTSAQKTLLGKTVSTAAPTSASDDTTLPTSKAVYSAITGERDATATLTHKTIDATANTIRNLNAENFAASNIAKGGSEVIGSSTKLTTETYVTEAITGAAGAGLSGTSGKLSVDLTANGGLQLDGSGDAATLSVKTDDATISKNGSGALKVNTQATLASAASGEVADALAVKTALAGKVDNTRTINSKALSSNIVLDGSDIHTSISYAKAGSAAAIAAGESIDTALGKLEYKADQAVTGIKLNSASSTLSPTSGIVTLGLGTAATENVATSAIADGSADTSLVTAQQVAAYAGGKIVNDTTATDTNKALSASATKTLLDGKAAKNGSNSEAFDVSTLRTAGAITVRDDTTGTHSAIISAITNGSTGSLLNISTGVKAANLTLGPKAATGISTDIGGAYAAKDPILATEAYADKKVADATIFTNKNRVLISDATSGAIVESAVTGTQLSLLSGMTAVDTDYTTSSAKTTTFATVGTVDGAFTAKTFSGTLADSTPDTTLTTASQVATYVSGKVVDNTSATDTNKALSANATKTLLADKFDNSRITKLSSEAANTATVYSTGKTDELLGYKFDKADIVTSTAGWSTTTSDTKVASEKLVKDSLDLKLTGTKEATYNSSASGDTYYTAATVNSSFAKLNGDPTVNFSAATLAATTVNATTVNAGTNGTALTDGTLRLKNATYDTTLSAISDGTSGSLLNISTGAKVNGNLEATGNVKAAGLTLGSKTATSISTDITGATNNNVLATEAYADTKIAKTDIVKSTAGWSATPSDDKVTSEKLVYESLHGTGNATTPAGAVVIGDKAATTTLGTTKAQVALNDSAQTATITAANGIILSGPTTVTSIKFSGDAATDPAIVGVSQTVAGATANKLVTEGAVFAKTGTVTFSGMNYVGSATDLTTAVSNLDTNVYKDIHGTGTASAPAGAVAIGDKAATTTLGTTKAKIALNDSAQTATITAANGISLDGTKFVKSIDTATDTTTPANNDILATKSTVTNAIKGIFSGNNVWTGTNEFQNKIFVTDGAGTTYFKVDTTGSTAGATTIAKLILGTSTSAPVTGIVKTVSPIATASDENLATELAISKAIHGTGLVGNTIALGDNASGTTIGDVTSYYLDIKSASDYAQLGSATQYARFGLGTLLLDDATYTANYNANGIKLHKSSGDTFTVDTNTGNTFIAGTTRISATPTGTLTTGIEMTNAGVMTAANGGNTSTYGATGIAMNGTQFTVDATNGDMSAANGNFGVSTTGALTTVSVNGDLSAGKAANAQLTVDTANHTISAVTKNSGMQAGIEADGDTVAMEASNTTHDYYIGADASAGNEGVVMAVTAKGDTKVISGFAADKDSVELGLNDVSGSSAKLDTGIKVEDKKVTILANDTSTTDNPVLEAGYDTTAGSNYVTVNGDLTATGDFSAAGNTFTVANNGTKTTMTLTGDEVVNGKATFNGSSGKKVEIENGVVTASDGFAVNSGSGNVFTVNAAGKTTTTTLAFTGDSGTNTVNAIDDGSAAQELNTDGSFKTGQQTTMATVGTVLKSAQNATYTNGNGINTVLATTDDTITEAINKIDYVLSDVSNSLGDYSDLATQAATAGSNITVESPAPGAPAKTPTLVSAAIDLDNAIGNRGQFAGAGVSYADLGAATGTHNSVATAIANVDKVIGAGFDASTGDTVYVGIHGDATHTVNIGDQAKTTMVGTQDGFGNMLTGMTVDTATAGSESITFTVDNSGTPTDVMTIDKDSVDITGDETVSGDFTAGNAADAKFDLDRATHTVEVATADATAGTSSGFKADGSAAAITASDGTTYDYIIGANADSTTGDNGVSMVVADTTSKEAFSGFTADEDSAEMGLGDGSTGAMIAGVSVETTTPGAGTITMEMGINDVSGGAGAEKLDTGVKVEDKKVSILVNDGTTTDNPILVAQNDATNGNHVDITGDENVTGNITVQDTITPSTAKVEIKNDGSVKTTDTTGAKTVELKDGAATASEAVTAGAITGAGALSGDGVQMKKDGTITAVATDATSGNTETAHYDAAGITLNSGATGGTAADDTFTVDSTNGDMMAAAGNFAVQTAASGTTTMTIAAPVATATTGKVTIDTTGKIESIGSATGNTVTIDDGNVVVSGDTKTKTFTMPDATTSSSATPTYTTVTGIDLGTPATNTTFSDKDLATTESIKTKAENAIYTPDASLKAAGTKYATATAGTINDAIENLDKKVGDWNALKLTPNGNLTNGHSGDAGYSVPETVVDAFNNIDATLGRIHGLVQKNTDGTYTYNKSSGAVTQDWTNLAVGTTVEDHVLAVDTAIGNRNQYSHEYNIAKGDAIADSLEKIDVRMGDVASLNQMNYYREQNPNDVNLSSAVRALDTNLYRLEHDFKTLRHETHAGLASAAALSALVPNPRSAGDTTLSFGTGAYQGHTAAAFGGFHWITNNLMVNAGVGWDNREATARMGVSYSF